MIQFLDKVRNYWNTELAIKNKIKRNQSKPMKL